MGLYSPRYGGCQDVQNEPAFPARRLQSPDVDITVCDGGFCVCLGAQYQFPGSYLWFDFWIWLYVKPSLSLPVSPFRPPLPGLRRLTNDKGGLGYLKFLAPPEWALRWIEGKLNLLGRLPHYVSVDQKTYGRFGVLPTTTPTTDSPLGYVGGSQRLGP
jgi:hypothetical protein